MKPLSASILFVIVLLLSISMLSACKTYYPPVVYHQIKKEIPYDAIIVPGYPFDSESGNYLMKIRVLWAKHLFEEGLCENIIFTGGSVYSPYYESEVMKLYALELGLPENRLFTEKQAEHTTENLVYSYLMADSLGFEKVGFATDVYQTTFLAAHLNKLNMKHVDLLPISYSKIKPASSIEVASVPYQLAENPDFVSILESQSVQERKNRSKGKMAEKMLSTFEGN